MLYFKHGLKYCSIPIYTADTTKTIPILSYDREETADYCQVWDQKPMADIDNDIQALILRARLEKVIFVLDMCSEENLCT